jgi:hypothetical protein
LRKHFTLGCVGVQGNSGGTVHDLILGLSRTIPKPVEIRCGRCAERQPSRPPAVLGRLNQFDADDYQLVIQRRAGKAERRNQDSKVVGEGTFSRATSEQTVQFSLDSTGTPVDASGAKPPPATFHCPMCDRGGTRQIRVTLQHLVELSKRWGGILVYPDRQARGTSANSLRPTTER